MPLTGSDVSQKELGALNLILTAQTLREQQLLVPILKQIMVHNYVEIIFLQLLQIHVLIELVNKIPQQKMIRFAIYGFRRLVIVKTVFGVVQMDVFPLNNVLHFKEQLIHVLSLQQQMALVKEQIL